LILRDPLFAGPTRWNPGGRIGPAFLVSIVRSKPTVLQTVSFSRFDFASRSWGRSPDPRRPPGLAFAQIENSEEADEGVGCRPGGPPNKKNYVACATLFSPY
jgi:hypothetical protein